MGNRDYYKNNYIFQAWDYFKNHYKLNKENSLNSFVNFFWFFFVELCKPYKYADSYLNVS